MTLKQSVKAVVPAPVLEVRGRFVRLAAALKVLIPAFVYDFRRYLRFSSTTGAHTTKENLRAKITATYHNIEKGLSLPDPRPGFGAAQIDRLLALLNTYVSRHGYDQWSATPFAVLREYKDFNDANQVPSPHAARLSEALRVADERLEQSLTAGVKQVSREDVERAVSHVDLSFFTTRSSVRQYDGSPVDPAHVEFATRAALHAPAVCNRQFAKVYAFADRAQIDALLSVQGGARGFAGELGGLAVLTVDLRAYWQPGERHQAWVDGGLFAMSFVHGLHARGLGTVCLNWSKTPADDLKLRELIDLPEAATVVMMVGYGNLREHYRVAHSQRLDLQDVLVRDGFRSA